MRYEEILHEFPSKNWARSQFNRMLRQLIQEGSADTNMVTHRIFNAMR